MYTLYDDVNVIDIGDGATRKILSYSPTMMLVEVSFPAGGVGAAHSHPHEQIGYLVSGRLIYMEEGAEDKELKAGDSYIVAPGVVHGVKAIEPSVILDIFTPMREDFL